MKKLTLLALLGLVSAPLLGQNFDEVKIKTTKVSDHIYMLEGSGGNIGVSVGEDGALMIDSQYAPLSDKIRRAIEALTDEPIKLLLNTHWHGDHSGGNQPFAEMGAMIVAHDNVRERMSKTQLMKAFSREIPPAPEEARPVVTFNDQLSLRCNGEYLMMVHVDSAHTDGDALIYFPESDVMHMGDTYFAGRYPFIDQSSGGTIDGLIEAVNHALFLTTDDTKIIPGHGPLSNKFELKAYRDVLKQVRDGVAHAKAQGKSLEEIQADPPTADMDASWGSGFISSERFIDLVYSTLYD